MMFRLIYITVGALLAMALFITASGWIRAWTASPEMRPRVRSVLLVALQCAGWLHVVCWLVVPATAVLMGSLAILRRRHQRPVRRAGKLALLAGSMSFGLFASELLGAHLVAESRRPPLLPSTFPEAKRPGELSLVVIGESSAMGLPYDPWVSTGQILAWQMEQRLPGRHVSVEMHAHGGICLEQAIIALQELKRKPDLLLIYAGHNEFQARFGWSRSVRYYIDEHAQPLRSQLESWWLKTSPMATVIHEALDRQRLDEPPPPNTRRALVDHPAFRREEYEYLLDDFERRLLDVVRYAKRLGAVPIVVAPAGNEVDYPPFRSCLRPEADAAERDRFARLMQRARGLEKTDSGGAHAAYLKLVKSHPEFAELHYRIGVMALRKNDLNAARAAFRRARDLDAMPMRCPADFQDAIARVARAENVVYVDGPAVLARLNEEQLLDGRLFHDPQHPNLYSYTALALQALDELATRRAFGLREGPGPALARLDAIYPAVVDHFGMGNARWGEICHKTAVLFTRIAQISHQPYLYLQQAHQLVSAADAIKAGTLPEESAIMGIGRRPPPSRRAAEPTEREGQHAQDQREATTPRHAPPA